MNYLSGCMKVNIMNIGSARRYRVTDYGIHYIQQNSQQTNSLLHKKQIAK